MEVFSSYKNIPTDWHPLVLTIGKFDAVHRGHCALLDQAKEIAAQLNGHLCVLTFINHPVEVLKEGKFIQRLCTGVHKLKLLSEHGVDGVIQLEFTREFARQTAEQFIQSLHHHLPFMALVLGYDAHLGSDRQANTSQMQNLAKKYGYALHYAAPCTSEGVIVSSSLIREAISRGDLALVEKMLGRKYSILAFAASETPQKIIIANLMDLCLPPPGVYHVMVCCEGSELSARAVISKEVPVLVLECDEKNCTVGDRALEIVFNL